jgi:transposase InsO family protein
MRTDLVLDALRMALTRRERGAELELVHHSDAGSSQYTSFAFQQELDDHRVLQSIGTVGDAFDNALAESFVALKTELIADRVWRTRSQLGAGDRGMGRLIQLLSACTSRWTMFRRRSS